MFKLIGSFVQQFRQRGGVPGEAAAPTPAADGAGGETDGGDAIARLLAAGRLNAALELAYEAQRAAPSDVAAHGAYHRLLALTGRDERLLAHARRYLTLLLQRAQGFEALELYREMQEREPGFACEQPGQLLRLADAARRQGEFAPALALLKGYDKRFPNNDDIPAAYLFAARVLCEDLRQDASARQLLGVLIKRYPGHPLCAEARQLAARLEALPERVAAD